VVTATNDTVLSDTTTYTTDTYSLSDNALTIGGTNYTVDVTLTNATVTWIVPIVNLPNKVHLKAVASPKFDDLLASSDR